MKSINSKFYGERRHGCVLSFSYFQLEYDHGRYRFTEVNFSTTVFVGVSLTGSDFFFFFFLAGKTTEIIESAH